MIITALLLGGLPLLASCGAEAPTFAPGSIIVTSTPPGAAIFIDGAATGTVTPDTLLDLEPAIYQLSVELAEFVPDRDVVSVDLKPLDARQVDFLLSQTGFRIESPAGARILVDGIDTGKIVPAAVAGLEPGTVAVSLELDGYLILPASQPVAIADREITLIPAGTFSARAQKTVILEGFANVSCLPCPQLTDNLLGLTGKPGFTDDRVVFMEFSVSWPELGDPFFLANPQGNADRYNLYQVQGAPELYVDGVRQADALDPDALETAVLAALETEPGFLVEVAADFATSSVPVSVTLDAYRNVDLTGCVLFVAIYEEAIVLDTAPGLNGQTEFHHVFRDRVDPPQGLGVLSAGSSQDFDFTLGAATPAPGKYVALAFVQHGTSRAILQAGSTAEAGPVPAAERNHR